VGKPRRLYDPRRCRALAATGTADHNCGCRINRNEEGDAEPDDLAE
jgi:hypothetical protein